MPADNLTQLELDTLERATKWISLRDTSATYLRGFIISSISDLALSLKVAALTEDQLKSLLTYLNNRRKK